MKTQRCLEASHRLSEKKKARASEKQHNAEMAVEMRYHHGNSFNWAVWSPGLWCIHCNIFLVECVDATLREDVYIYVHMMCRYTMFHYSSLCCTVERLFNIQADQHCEQTWFAMSLKCRYSGVIIYFPEIKCKCWCILLTVWCKVYDCRKSNWVASFASKWLDCQSVCDQIWSTQVVSHNTDEQKRMH